MSKLKELREQRAALADRASELNARFGDRPMPAADANRLSGWLDEIELIDRKIDREAELARAAGTEPGLVGRQAGLEASGQDGARPMRTAAQFQAYYTRRAGASTRDSSSATLADFLRGVAGAGGAPSESVRAALSEGTDAAGGFMVPHVVMPQILEALVPASAVLAAGGVIVPVDMGAKSYTTTAVDSIPTAAWREENGEVAESDPTFRGVVAAPKSLSFYFKVSRELLADAAGFGEAAVTAFAQAFAKALDLAALRGSGTSPTPRGLLNVAGVNPVGNGANGASLATTKWANFHSAAQAIMEDDAAMPTAAIMSPRTRVTLGGLVDTTGQPLMVPEMLKNMGMYVTSQVPNNLTVGTSTDCSEIYVGDFTKVQFVMRERVSVQRLDQVFATSGQVGFIGHVRADIVVTYPKAFAIVTGVRP